MKAPLLLTSPSNPRIKEIAKLRQRTVQQRVENLIAVAHPDFRAELRKAANDLMYY